MPPKGSGTRPEARSNGDLATPGTEPGWSFDGPSNKARKCPRAGGPHGRPFVGCPTSPSFVSSANVPAALPGRGPRPPPTTPSMPGPSVANAPAPGDPEDMSARPPLSAEGAPEGLDLRHYAEVLWHRKRLIGICLLVGILLAGAYAFLAPKSYRSKAVVEVKPTKVRLPDLATAGLDKAINMDTERQVASSTTVATIAADSLGSTGTPQSLLKHVNVNVPTDTQ